MKALKAMFLIVYALVFLAGIWQTHDPKNRTLLHGHVALMLVVGILALVVYIHD